MGSYSPPSSAAQTSNPYTFYYVMPTLNVLPVSKLEADPDIFAQYRITGINLRADGGDIESLLIASHFLARGRVSDAGETMTVKAGFGSLPDPMDTSILIGEVQFDTESYVTNQVERIAPDYPDLRQFDATEMYMTLGAYMDDLPFTGEIERLEMVCCMAINGNVTIERII